jgi:hypothetical protein
VGKSRKRTERGEQYQAMAAGYRILRSPLADSYGAAAEHYRESDPPLEPTGSSARVEEPSLPRNGSQ